MRRGEKHILGESTLTCGDDMEECGDRPDAGEKTSSWLWCSSSCTSNTFPLEHPVDDPPDIRVGTLEDDVDDEVAAIAAAATETVAGTGWCRAIMSTWSPRVDVVLLPPDRYLSLSKESNLKTCSLEGTAAVDPATAANPTLGWCVLKLD